MIAKNKDEVQYWTPDRIKKLGCDYNIIISGRSDGKTTAIIGEIVKDYIERGSRGQYVRYLQEDFNSGRAVNLMRSLEYAGENRDINLISEWTDGEYTTTKYQSRAWFLGREVEDADGAIETVFRKDPFCYATALSQVGRDKSATPANVGIVHLDEFIPVRGVEPVGIVDDFVNLLSTTVRASPNVTVYLTANTVSWNSAFFEHFGIENDVVDMKLGEIRVFEAIDGDESSTLAVERGAPARRKSGKGKPSDKFFLWGSGATSRMVTDGAFAVPEYPRCPHHFTQANVKFTYWLEEPGKAVLRVRLLKVDSDLFVFVDRVPPEVKERLERPRDLHYSLEFTGARNHYVDVTRVYAHPATAYLADALQSNRVFFADDKTGTDFVYFVDRGAQRSVLRP